MSIADDINAISDRVLALEQENDLLRQQLASGNTEAYDKLIDLLTEDIEWQERHMTDRTSPKMKSIVEAYRAVRPK
jgi:ketosteroid isomerase-like protein